MDLKTMLARIDAGLQELQRRAAAGENVGVEVAQLSAAAADARAAAMATHGPSRFATEHASAEGLAALAAGQPGGGVSLAPGGALGGADAGLLLPDGRGLFPASPEEGQRLAQLGAASLVRGLKAMAEGTGSAGGFAVPVQYAPGIMPLIRARSAILSMGPTTVPVEKEMDLTSISSGAAAQFVAENALLPASEIALAQAPILLPKELGTILPVSLRLLRDAGQEIADAIYADLAEVLALRMDLAFIQGTGSGAEPLGIKNKAGTLAGPSFGANGRTPTFDDIKAIPAGLRAANAPFLKPGWVFHPRLLSTLEMVKDTTGRYLADAGLLEFDETGGGGKLLGFPFRTTSQLPVNVTTGSNSDTTFIIFSSDWRDAVWVGVNKAFELDWHDGAAYTTDGGTTTQYAFQQRQRVFRAQAAADIALRRPGLVSVTTGVRP